MRVTVRLFARLHDITGRPEMVREMPPGSTIRELWREMVVDFPALAAYEGSMSSALNADYARLDARVSDGDEVAFLPPVSGG